MTDVRQRRYALIGAGQRSQTYLQAIAGPHADAAHLVALIDSNPERARYQAERLIPADDRLQVASPDELDRLIHELQVDRVIVTTPDYLHAEYIDVALRAGADVVSEKPLTIDAAGARRVAAAVEQTGREVVVTFNYRYSPRNAALKQLVQSGEIGEVTAVHFEWVLDTSHGADYFRRWHRDKAKSGGLLIHKASHHFDLINWWIDDVPVQVFAAGGLRFYGAANAATRGLRDRPARGTHDGPTDPFQLDLRRDEHLRQLYLNTESHDGYLRDRDVFSDGITIEDTLSLVVRYQRAATLSYSLVAYSPWEGYRVSITGTKGRAELEVVERAALTSDRSGVLDPSATPHRADSGYVRRKGERLVLQRHWEPAIEIAIESAESGHGGGDALLLSDVFVGPKADPLSRPASWTDGVNAIAVGIAGNISLVTDRAVSISELELDTLPRGKPAPGTASA